MHSNFFAIKNIFDKMDDSSFYFPIFIQLLKIVMEKNKPQPLQTMLNFLDPIIQMKNNLKQKKKNVVKELKKKSLDYQELQTNQDLIDINEKNNKLQEQYLIPIYQICFQSRNIKLFYLIAESLEKKTFFIEDKNLELYKIYFLECLNEEGPLHYKTCDALSKISKILKSQRKIKELIFIIKKNLMH